MITALQQVSVRVLDVARAKSFYGEGLGLAHLFDAGPKLAFFDCGGVRLMVTTAEQPEFDHPGSILYFRVADIRAEFEAMRARGVAFRGEPHLVAKLPDREVWMAFFDDGEGNVHALVAEPPIA